MEGVDDFFDLKINEYICKFGGHGKFVKKIINSFDCVFAIVDVKTRNVEITNSPDFFQGMKCRDLFKVRYNSCMPKDCPIEQVVLSKRSVVVRHFFLEDKSFEVHGCPIFDSSGNVVNVIVCCFDVGQTDALIESEKKIKEQKEKVEKYLDLAGNIILALDVDGNIKLLNKKGYEVLGYDKDSCELIGKNWFNCCLPKYNLEEVRGVFNKLMRGKSKFVEDYENAVLTKSGEERIILWHNSLVKDESGRVVEFLSSGEDITEKRRTDVSLKNDKKFYVNKIEERFYDILQNSQGLVYSYNFEKNVFDYVSESVFTILGYSLGEFMEMGKNGFESRIHPDDLDSVKDVGDGSESEYVSTIEYRFRKKDGDYVWLMARRVFFRNDEGNLIYSVEEIVDITDRKIIEEEKIRLENQIAIMSERNLNSKEKIALTKKEQLVLWGLCRYPILNDEELAEKLYLKRSTLTAIRNRLKANRWFTMKYIPNFRKLGCQYFSVFDVDLSKGGKMKKIDLSLTKKFPEVILGNYQDDKFFGVFVSDKYVNFKKFFEQFIFDNKKIFRIGFSENSFFYDLDIVELRDASGLVNSLFDLRMKNDFVSRDFVGPEVELNINEKRVLHTMIGDSDMSSSDIAKKVWISKPTVIKIRNRLLKDNIIYPIVVPDFRKMGFPYIARFSFNFDSEIPSDIKKNGNDPRIILRVIGRKSINKFMLFSSEEEYFNEIDLIRNIYRKSGIYYDLDSNIFCIQKRGLSVFNIESFIGDFLFKDDI